MLTLARMAHLSLALLLLLPTLATVTLAQDEAARTSPSELLGNPGLFDGKPITIRHGAQPSSRWIRVGKGYYTFDLSDGTEAVRVVAMGRARCKVGRTTVDGPTSGSSSRPRRRGSGVADRAGPLPPTAHPPRDRESPRRPNRHHAVDEGPAVDDRIDHPKVVPAV
jgi:hypothetical protein